MNNFFNKHIYLLIFFSLYLCEADHCRINVDCEECLPEFLPVVLSHTTISDVIQVEEGERVHLHCNHGKFSAFPNVSSLELVCKQNYFQSTSGDLYSVHISELGCDVDAYEDVIHEVEHCRNPFEGRSYQFRNHSSGHIAHLAEVCYDNAAGRTVFLHVNMSVGNQIQSSHHVDRENRMSLLGSFNKMFDRANILEAEKIYDFSNSLSMKVKRTMGNHHFNFVNQQLVSAKLIPSSFFFNQNGRVTKFVSNKMALWDSVASGNIRNIHKDILSSFKRSEYNPTVQSVELFVGTHDTLALPVKNKYVELFLKPGRKYPVPKYIWMMVYDKAAHKAVVLVAYNNPFTSISEIRSSVFCPSVCSKLNWINHLKNDNNYERSVYGLVFCCDVHSFSKHVADAPNIAMHVYEGERGVLKDSL